jgi:tetraacyldisaccharide 4'-kinase
MKWSRWERYYIELVKGKRKGIFAAILLGVLRACSWIFQLLVACRNWAFDSGWLRRYYPPVPLVISVGNIVAGGTGKTPVTMMLAQVFHNEYLIAILSRGYRSQAENMPAPVWLSKGNGPMHPANFCGDEPYLLALNLPKALVFVGRDRHKASNMAARAGAQVILLDDGMQHRRLARDLEVVVIDAYDPFGESYFLPRGFLREGIKSLARADLVILNHIQEDNDFEQSRQLILPYTKAPVIGTRMQVTGIYDLEGNAAEGLKDKVVGIFCGIAHPDYFHKTVIQEGAQVINSLIAPDHETCKPAALEKFANQCKAAGAHCLVCTEKDKVKLNLTHALALPIVWIKSKLGIIRGETEWNAFIAKAKTDINRRI